MTAVWVVLPVVLSLGLADRAEMVDVPLLYGIASLVVGSDSIEVTKDDSLPRGLDLRTKGGSVSKATIRVDESFDVTDGHHLGHSFKLLSIDKGMATLEMEHQAALPSRGVANEDALEPLEDREV